MNIAYVFTLYHLYDRRAHDSALLQNFKSKIDIFLFVFEILMVFAGYFKK